MTTSASPLALATKRALSLELLFSEPPEEGMDLVNNRQGAI